MPRPTVIGGKQYLFPENAKEARVKAMWDSLDFVPMRDMPHSIQKVVYKGAASKTADHIERMNLVGYVIGNGGSPYTLTEALKIAKPDADAAAVAQVEYLKKHAFDPKGWGGKHTYYDSNVGGYRVLATGASPGGEGGGPGRHPPSSKKLFCTKDIHFLRVGG